MGDIRGLQQKLTNNMKCDGCGVIVGPQSPYGSVLYKVTDGKTVGNFHSRECYLSNSVKKEKEESV